MCINNSNLYSSITQTQREMAKHGQTLGSTRIPQGVGWCRGGNRNAEGWWGCLQLKIKSKFQNVKRPKFQNYKFEVCRIVGTHICKSFQFSYPHISNKYYFSKWFGICSWTFKSILVSPQMNNVGLGSHGHVHQVRTPWQWWLFGFS